MEDRNDASTSNLSDSTSGNSNDAGETTRSAVETVKASAKDIVGTVKDTARSTVSDVKEQAMSKAAELQSSAADQAKTAATTLRKSAEGLEDELPWMRSALNKTADGIDHLTSALNRGDMNQTLASVSEFAKRQPALFLGLSVAAGFAIARIGKTAIEKAVPAADNASDGLGVDPSTSAV